MGRADPGQLRKRIVSALILAPVGLAAVWFGGGLLAALVLLAVAGMAWEWARICCGGRFGPTGWVMLGAAVASVGVLAAGAGGIACGIVIAGAVLAGAVAAVSRSGPPVWVAGGLLWIAVGTMAFLWLALSAGRASLLWLLAVVWASDIAAYAAGRTLGGPKLAPRLSPNKTWSGAAGGLLAAGLVGILAMRWASVSASAMVRWSLVLGFAAQVGDLVESTAKRHFGVKDSSGLIPGHGGLLDRLDGLLVAAAAAAALCLAAGNSPLPAN